jgi:alpha-beta hydrolase superfamily lysophospholipase
MPDSTFTIPSGTESIHVYRWEPEGEPKAVVQIAHGIAEHAARYERFARALNGAGYAVYANDHRGHGRTAGSVDRLGVFAERDGWATVVADLHALTRRIHEDHPEVPVFLLGHSMGSIMARSYAAQYGHEIDGLILSGPARRPGIEGQVGRAFAVVEGRLRGRTTPSPFLDWMAMGQNNKRISSPRTKFDWLSRDPAEVDKYVADEYCGGVSSTGLLQDMVIGLTQAYADDHASLVRKDLPIHVLAGGQDPVGAFGRGATDTAEQYRKVGVKDVSLKLYPESRHELLNDTNREEVTADLIAWLDAHLPTSP